MSWNYRVLKRRDGSDVSYGIYEVYYDDAGSVVACSESPSEPYGETFEELVADLKLFAVATTQPPLDYDEIVDLEEKGL
jgi:hypothetical protein